MQTWTNPYVVAWYFPRGRRGEARLASRELAIEFAEAMKRAQRPLVIVTSYDWGNHEAL